MSLGTEVDFSPDDIVLDWDPAPPRKGETASEFWRMYYGQTAALIKMPLGTGVDLGPGHIVLHEDPAPS